VNWLAMAHASAGQPAPWRTLALAALVLLLAWIAGRVLAPADLAAAWLVAWWGWTGLALGALGLLYLDRLAGGRWSAALRPDLHRCAAMLPALALLVLPLLHDPAALFPWATPDWTDPARMPAFREAWRALPFFAARLVGLVGLWTLLGWMAPGLAGRGRSGAAALGMLALGWSVSLAAADVVMSLSPTWYSSAIGLLVLVCQFKLALAWGVARAAHRIEPDVRNDLGNLLLTFVMSWAYLEFTQFQIIWAEDLPHEITWYLPRYLGEWRWLGLALVVGGLALPFALLLWRRVKRSAAALTCLAWWIAACGIAELLWQILPSVRGVSWHQLWLLPLLCGAMGAQAWTGGTWLRRTQTARGTP
jgi:hypothetical protein